MMKPEPLRRCDAVLVRSVCPNVVRGDEGTAYCALNCQHDALRITCPTCGGTEGRAQISCLGCGATWINDGGCSCTCIDGCENYENWISCCTDGRMSIERAWKIVAEVQALPRQDDPGAAQLLAHLRGIR